VHLGRFWPAQPGLGCLSETGEAGEPWPLAHGRRWCRPIPVTGGERGWGKWPRCIPMARGSDFGWWREEKLTVERAPRRWAVGRRGSAWRGWPAVVSGRLLGREGVQHLGGARGGADVARGGPVRAGVTEALGGSGAAPVALFGVSARRQGGWLGTGRWRRRPWRSCSGAQGAVVGLGRRWLIKRARRAEE
jgi:hypothetical protein